jgi:hypothetical protein
MLLPLQLTGSLQKDLDMNSSLQPEKKAGC